MRPSEEQFIKYESERDVVFIFGAGASYADGAPLQADLLPHILHGNDSKITESRLGRSVIDFIVSHFFISASYTPSLESVFGYIDYFINAAESLGDDFGTARIAEIKESLIKLLHYTIAKKRGAERGVYQRFWERAKEHSLNIGVISLNYDTLLDEAFDFLYPDVGYIDYCVNLMNYDWYDKYHKEIEPFNWWINPREPVPVWEGGNPRPIKLIKLHGSLNWKYCNCCNQVLLTPWQSDIDLNTMGFVRYDYTKGPHDSTPIEFRCPIDSTRFNTLILPPSHIKDLTHPVISQLRTEAAREIRCAKKLVFVGYSFPEADVHIKALFAKNKNPDSRIIVVNRTVNEPLKASYLSLDNKTIFEEVPFAEALEDEGLINEIFSNITV